MRERSIGFLTLDEKPAAFFFAFHIKQNSSKEVTFGKIRSTVQEIKPTNKSNDELLSILI